MKNLEIENYSLVELSSNEEKEINGGIIPWLTYAAIATAVYYANELSKEVQKGWDAYPCSHK